MSGDDPNASGPPICLLISRDLIFTTKILGTAKALGMGCVTAGYLDGALGAIAEYRPGLVLVDLDAGEAASPIALAAYRSALAPSSTLLAFGSHVEAVKLAEAKAAGCDPVWPRSRFVNELPDLIRSRLGG